MSEIIASPSTRRLARDNDVDIDALARRLGRTTIGPEDITGNAPAPAGAGGRQRLLGRGPQPLRPGE